MPALRVQIPQVLRFYAYWDDPTRYGARQYFVMHYFLCDDTVEINNNYMRNSGRWECPVFFTRKELELQPTMTHTPGMYKPASPLLKASDIEVHLIYLILVQIEFPFF